MGHYVDQVKNAYNTDWTAAKEALNDNVMSMYNTIKSIIEENDFPAKAEERWTPMMESIKSNAEKLNTDIETKYNEMISRAKQFDDWYAELKELEGDPGGETGLKFAIDKGFGRWVGTYIGRGLKGINWRQSTLYRWTAYRYVKIDSSTGYITIEVVRREMKKAINENDVTWIEHEKVLATKIIEIKSSEDFAKYNKTGISKDGLTIDHNEDGNSTFK